ncbi:hypothetical protein FGO68_gene14075 [Halteria grandinella]|uniref:protein-tyrosine-phosphatase n=1 Tax=Halteria grandinella TaxID=5974 RepID=A0A8J8SY79_HALGN|nr:hypothetical protein FGO68_gene14075 [Halteria grandinella]
MKPEPDLILERPASLYLGNQFHAQNYELLKSRDIQVILQVSGEDTQPPHPEHFEYHRFVFGDAETVDITEHAKKAVEVIEKCHLEGKGVFVHCAAGVSRSASLVIAYVMKIQKVTFQEALKLVSAKRPCVGPNDGFKRTLSTMQL